MKKLFSKKAKLILGTAVIATGLVTLPVLADTQNSANWFGQMQSFMNQTFAPGEHQQIMNSSAMQKLHNSTEMQQAMQSGDVNKMQELMNSDPQVKAQVGQDTLDKMNQFMSQNQAAISQAVQGQNCGTDGPDKQSDGQVQHPTSQRGMGVPGMMGVSNR